MRAASADSFPRVAHCSTYVFFVSEKGSEIAASPADPLLLMSAEVGCRVSHCIVAFGVHGPFSAASHHRMPWATASRLPSGYETLPLSKPLMCGEIPNPILWGACSAQSFRGVSHPYCLHRMSARCVHPRTVVPVINVWRIFHSYVRIPLVVETFARDGMAAALLNPQLQALLEAVLFEPLEYARTWRHVQPPLYV